MVGCGISCFGEMRPRWVRGSEVSEGVDVGDGERSGVVFCLNSNRS